MSTPIIVRDTVVAMLEAVKGHAELVGVPDFDVSLEFLTAEETTRAATYCVVVTDETWESFTHAHFEAVLTVKIVMYANDSLDPHRVLRTMKQDAHRMVMALHTHPATKDLVRNVRPISFTVPEPTTMRKSWAQGVAEWTLRYSDS